MWVVQASLFTLQMTLFLNSNLSYVEFPPIRGTFFWKIASKCLSAFADTLQRPLCLCKMTFAHLTMKNKCGTAQRAFSSRGNYSQAFYSGAKTVDILFCSLESYLFLTVRSSWNCYRYFILSCLKYLLKFRWENPETFWLFGNILYGFKIIFGWNNSFSPEFKIA